MKHIIFFVLLSVFMFGCSSEAPPQLDDAGVSTKAACTFDNDCDGLLNNMDNCIYVANIDQADDDVDGLGDACDACRLDPVNDPDKDGACAIVDNCPAHRNIGQTDSDSDGFGNACDQNDANTAAIADLDARLDVLEALQIERVRDIK